MPRDFRLFLDDVLDAVTQVREYTFGFGYEEFSGDRRTQDAVMRNLEIRGEAVGRLPESIKAAAPEIKWKKIVGFRNIVAHEYFGVSLPLVWDIVMNELGSLETACRRLLAGDSLEPGVGD